MKFFYLYICPLFLFIELQSQNIIVYDSIEKKPIPFSTIKYKNGGEYTDLKGYFHLPLFNPDSIYVSSVGFESIKIRLDNIKDTIFLKQKVNTIKEVLIDKSYKKKVIDFLKKPKSFGSFPLNNKFEIITIIIPTSNYLNNLISEIGFSFEKLRKPDYNNDKDFFKNHNGVIRINIYKIIKGQLSIKIYSTKPLMFNNPKTKKIFLNLDEQSILFKKEGIGIGIEYIGHINNNGSLIINKKHIRPTLTNKPSKVYIQQTFLKGVFSEDSKIIPLSEIQRNFINRNLSFSLILSK